MRIVAINGKVWAVGLNWQPIVRTVTPAAVLNAAESAMEAVSGEKPDMVCVRKSQFGFGFSGRRPKQFSGLMSLGASLDIPYRSFLGCFKLVDTEGGEFWWVFARYDGENIGGFADTCYDTEKDAESAVRALKSLNKFEEEYLAQSIDTSVHYLEPFLGVSLWSRFTIESKVLPLDYFARRKKLLVAKVAAFALIGIGGWLASGSIGSFLAGFEFSSASQKAAIQAEARRRHFQEHPEELFAQDWQSVPVVHEVIGSCVDEIHKTPVSISGWLFDAAECRRGAVGVRVIRSYTHTPVARFDPLPATAKLDPKSPKALKDVADAPCAMSFVWKTLAWPDLPPESEVKTLFLQIAQIAEIKSSVKMQPREKKSIQDVGVITCPWAVGTWTLESVSPGLLTDGGLARVLATVPGIAVDSIGRDQAGFWKIAGKVYVK